MFLGIDVGVEQYVPVQNFITHALGVGICNRHTQL